MKKTQIDAITISRLSLQKRECLLSVTCTRKRKGERPILPVCVARACNRVSCLPLTDTRLPPTTSFLYSNPVVSVGIAVFVVVVALYMIVSSPTRAKSGGASEKPKKAAKAKAAASATPAKPASPSPAKPVAKRAASPAKVKTPAKEETKTKVVKAKKN